MILLYSLIWTVLVSCPLLLLIVVLRRRAACLMKYGVTFICILYGFCAIRMLIPIEVPVFQKVICDPHLYSHLMRDYALLDKVVKYKIVAIIIISWIVGSIIATVYYSSKIIKSFIQLQKTCYEGDGRAEQILKEIDPNSKIRIRYTDLVLTPFMVGMFKPTIYMTEVDCDDKELKYILMHEYTHWKRKDHWKQAFVYIMRIIFWWNPLFYFLNKDIRLMIEMGCDKTMLRSYPERYSLGYLKTLCFVAKSGVDKLDDVGISTLKFAKVDSQSGFKRRLYYAMDFKENLKVQKRVNIFVFCVCFIWMLSSYYFILQPTYSPDEEIQTLENQKDQIFDGRNTYIEKRKDGSYILYFGPTTQIISKEDVENGFYDLYPIINEK